MNSEGEFAEASVSLGAQEVDIFKTLDPAIQKELQDAFVQNMMAKWRDDVDVSSQLAAIFLTVSESTLRRIVKTNLLAPGKDHTDSASTAMNQKAHFNMKELRRCKAARLKAGPVPIQSSLRGLDFSTIDTFAIEQPFWTRPPYGNRELAIVGNAFTISADLFEKLLKDPNASIDWFLWQKALSMPWELSAERELFEPLYVSLLKTSLNEVTAGRDASAVLQGVNSES